MKTLFRKSDRMCNGIVLFLLFLMSSTGMAQIPQNIEVEGGPESGWQYLMYIFALLIVVGIIFLILRLKKGKKGLND